MDSEGEWQRLRGFRGDGARTHVSPIRVALLFGTMAIAVALFATSYLADRDGRIYANGANSPALDFMSTGSISNTKTYIVRKSVLQKNPGASCIIHADGSHVGDC